MEIYRCPDHLVLHLKRFSHQRSSFFSSKKIGDEIRFEVEGLDMTQYVLSNGGKNGGGGEPLIYDLYAVSNHYGSLNGGHYTAFCRNPIDNKWYEFDDSSVSRIDSGSAVTKAAYVLFYKKRKPKTKK